VILNDIKANGGYCMSLKNTNTTILAYNKCQNETEIALYVPSENLDVANQDGILTTVNDDGGWIS
jgi:hypothetical protein